MEAGRFEQTHTLIEKAERMLQESETTLGSSFGSGGESGGVLMPLDLVVKSGETLILFPHENNRFWSGGDHELVAHTGPGRSEPLSPGSDGRRGCHPGRTTVRAGRSIWGPFP